MPGPDRLLSRTESLVEQIGAAQRDIEERSLSGGLIMRHSRFVEVAQIIKLMAVHAFELPSPSLVAALDLLGSPGAGRNRAFAISTRIRAEPYWPAAKGVDSLVDRLADGLARRKRDKRHIDGIFERPLDG